MKYNLSEQNQIYLFQKQCKWLMDNQKICELKVIKKQRSLKENAALHLWMEHISKGLNDLGETFHYTGIFGKEFETRFTMDIVKTFIIKKLIKTMFNLDTTTKLTTENINELIDVINKYMGEKGLYLPWPSIQSLIEYYE